MKKLLILVILILITIPVIARSVDVNWVRQFNEKGGDIDYTFALNLAAPDKVYVNGDNNGTEDSVDHAFMGYLPKADDTAYYLKKIEESITISEPIIKEKNQYLTVNVKEVTSSLLKTGKPVLPVLRKVFTLPFGSKIRQVDVSFSGANQMVLSKKVQPGPKPTPKTGFKTLREPVKEDEVYKSLELYPSSSFDYKIGAGIKGDKRVIFLVVQCYPVKYSPGLDMLYYNQITDISVAYDEPIVPVSFPEEYDMVIIAPAIYSEELQPLITHKNGRGLQTTLKTTEEIYSEYSGRDEPEKIKYFIKDAIEIWGISFVLLVGGAAQVPGRYTHIYFDYDYQDYWVFLSDLYYADVYDQELGFSSWDSNENDVFAEYNWYGNTDEVDLYPDLYLGRLACINESQVTTCVNKIIAYETSQAHAQNWFTKLVLIGGDSLPGDEEEVDEGEYVNECVADIMHGFIPDRIWASKGKLNNAANISDAINNGAGFVFFNGHGNTHVWATHPHESSLWIPPGYYTNSHINALSNGGQLPVVVSDACYHCQYDLASDCFGWAFVTNPNGGCIAYLGGTDIDVSYGGVAIITKGIERLCLIMSTNYKQGDKTFGELWGNGITTYLSPVMDEIDYITVEEFQPFGDPSLLIAGDSQSPDKPAIPEGELDGKAGEENAYRSSTTDPDEDSLYYLFDWGDETYSEWVGPYASGDTAEAGHQWSARGLYEIRALARDKNGIFSEWSDSLTVCIYVLRGDANRDEEVTIADVVYMVNYIFKSDFAPDPLCVADVNCDGEVDVRDIVYLINYLFKDGPPLCE